MKFGSARGWHKWVSVILVVPMLLVGLTAVFIAHDKTLGTDKVVLPSVLGAQAMKTEGTIIRDTLVSGETQYVATQAGLYQLQGSASSKVAGLPSEDFRALALTGDGRVLVGGKMGLYAQSADGSWKLAREGDYHAVSAVGSTLVAYAKDQGAFQSINNGATWTSAAALDALSKSAAKAPESYTLKKLVMDVHTGKAFFGKQAEWIWIDILGITLVLLCLTGGWIWWRSQRQKSAAA